jgi:lysophospholipase L1-like esterase
VTEGGAEWDYVALGDSTVPGRSYVVYYAAHIEADLGVKVTLHNWGKSGETSAGLLYALRNDQELRNAISETEVVTFVIGANDLQSALSLYRIGACGGADNQDCLREMLTSFEANFDAIITEILALRSTTDTIIRTMDYFIPVVGKWKELGIYEDVTPYSEAFNKYIVQTASEHNIPVARVYLAFNGPNGDEDPVEKGYILPYDVHLSEAGHRLVADLHRELGYGPLGP